MKLVLRLTDYQLAVVEDLMATTAPATIDGLAAASIDHQLTRPAEARWSQPRPPRGSPPPTPADRRFDAVLPAATGAALDLAPGDRLRIVQLKDGQGVDLRASEPGGRALSAARTRANHGVRPSTGASLWSTSPEVPLLTIVADSAPAHDLTFPPCSEREYARHAGLAGHLGCSELHAGVGGGIGDGTDDVLNLWLPSAVDADGALRSWPAACRRGDYVEFAVHRRIMVTLSACPDDLFGTSQYEPGPVRVIVSGDRRASPVHGRWPSAPPPSALARNEVATDIPAATVKHLDELATSAWLGTSRTAVLRALIFRFHESAATGRLATSPT